MSVFIATGSNLGDRKLNLNNAKNELLKNFNLIAESRIYESPAVDYLNQPDFYNQVLEFSTPGISPDATMTLLLEIEKKMGRSRDILRGPRLIDLDILFWDDLKIQSEKLTLPHPRAFERSFVILPLSELPGFKNLEKKFNFTFSFQNKASPVFFD